MRIWRIGSALHPIWDGGGAANVGGRWNPIGRPVIYAAGSLSLAMLELLVQRGRFVATLVVAADVPDDVPVTDLMDNPPPNWRVIGSLEAQEAGAAWLDACRTALLRVPSAVVPQEANYLVNPSHPDAARIRVSAPDALVWDPRLFGIPAPW